MSNAFGINISFIVIIGIVLLVLFLAACAIAVVVLIHLLDKKKDRTSEFYEDSPLSGELSTHELTGNESIAPDDREGLDKGYWDRTDDSGTSVGGGVGVGAYTAASGEGYDDSAIGAYAQTMAASDGAYAEETKLLSDEDGERIIVNQTVAQEQDLLDDSVISDKKSTQGETQKEIYYEDDADSTRLEPDADISGLADAFVFRVNTEERREITKPEFSLGKSLNADYTINGNNTISRLHAIFICKDGQFSLVDNHSSNQTYLNDEKIEPDRMYPIKDGDRIRLSNEDFVFHVNG